MTQRICRFWIISTCFLKGSICASVSSIIFICKQTDKNRKTANLTEQVLAHTVSLCELQKDAPSVRTIIEAKSLASKAGAKFTPHGQAPCVVDSPYHHTQ